MDKALEKCKDNDVSSLYEEFPSGKSYPTRDFRIVADVLVREAYEAGMKAAKELQEEKEVQASATDFTTENIHALDASLSTNCILIGQKQLLQFYELQKEYSKSWGLDSNYSTLDRLVAVLKGKTHEIISFMGLRVILIDWPDLLVVGHKG